MSFGQRLRSIREELGWTQEHLSEVVGISLRSLIKYENDQAEPNMVTLTKMAKTLHISADRLLDLTPMSNIENNATLSIKEQYALEAWRRGDKLQAIKIILDE